MSLRLSCTRRKQGFDLDQLAGLGEIVERAVPQRGDRRFERRLAGEHDRFGIRAKLLGLGDDVDAVEARHVEIDQQAVERVLFQRGGGGQAVGQTVTRWPIRGISSFISSCSDRSSSANSRARPLGSVEASELLWFSESS